MAKHSDVSIKADGLEGTPIGATITYQVGQIPTASIDLAPPGDFIKLNGQSAFQDIDTKKRKSVINISIKVNTYAGVHGKISRSLNFKGLFDGLSIGNMVGGNTYQAVVKNISQVLLELTTMTPGLHPTSINIYRNPSYTMLHGGTDENEAVKVWNSIDGPNSELSASFKKPPIQFYTDLMKYLVKTQMSNWQKFTGTERMVDQVLPLEQIFNDVRYKRGLNFAQQLLNNIDLSAVTGGTSSLITASEPAVSSKLAEIFRSGPTILLENYRYFLAQMGCTLIFSNNKIFVVPENSVLKQPAASAAYRALQSQPNHANPADYNSYMYNDNGYRDVAHVLVQIGEYVGGTYLGGFTYENGVACIYSDTELSQATGVLVVHAHPWMTISPTRDFATEASEGKKKLDQAGQGMTKASSFSQENQTVKEAYVNQAKANTQKYKDLIGSALKNYAETKFYQARFMDRRGSITMDFNPDWVPGTGGTLYIRETGLTVAFYVESVTHRIDLSPPANGSAITVVNFSCGRMGKEPRGTSRDEYLGYDLGKEKAVQSAFIADNK